MVSPGERHHTLSLVLSSFEVLLQRKGKRVVSNAQRDKQVDERSERIRGIVNRSGLPVLALKAMAISKQAFGLDGDVVELEAQRQAPPGFNCCLVALLVVRNFGVSRQVYPFLCEFFVDFLVLALLFLAF